MHYSTEEGSMKRALLFFVAAFLVVVPVHAAERSVTVTTTHTFSVPGTHTISFKAWDEAGNSDEATIAVRVLCFPTISASLSPSTITSGSSSIISGRLLSGQLTIPPKQQIRVQYIYRGSWRTAGYVYTDTQGYYRRVVRPKTTTTYRAYYNGDFGSIKSAKSGNVILTITPPPKNNTVAAVIVLTIAATAVAGAGAYAYNKQKAA
jgi:hypothetical protein